MIESSLENDKTFKLSSVPMCVADRSGRIIATNPIFELRMGARADHDVVSLFVDAAERTSAEAALHRVLDTETPVVFRGLCMTCGEPRVLSWSCRAVDRSILAELHETEAAVTQQLEALLDALPDIYFRLDAEGRIIAWHAGRETELHVPPEQFIGKRPHDIVPPEVAPIIAGAVESVRANREPVKVEYTLPTPSGDDRFEARLVACGDKEVTSIIRNTTAHRRTEAALRASQEHLRASQKLEAVGQLAGGVAHDFNNLLGVILGRLGFLKRAPGLAEADLDHVKEAYDAASHAASLTRQLLAFSRRQVMLPQVFGLNSELSSLGSMLQRVVGEHIEVMLVLAASTCPINSDPVQIEQVVLNLALNGRDAMPDGGTLMLSTREAWLDEQQARQRDAAKAGPYVVLTVTDTGSGMTSEVMAHLFEPFFTTKSNGEGTGLGLASVYGIVKQSGGHVIVRSEVGVGTTFELYFPRSAEEPRTTEEPAAAEEASLAVPDDPSPARRETILVVEDGNSMRRLVVEVLEQAGYTTRSAVGGEEALRIVLEDTVGIALMLTDIVMPRMNGRTLAMRARQLRPGLRVLLMTAHEARRRGPTAAADGALPIIDKPFTEEALLARIREILNEPTND